MHKLKERFEPVKLSDAQKERILRNVKEGRMDNVRPRMQKGPLFASLIVGISMLFLMFNLLTEPETILQPDGHQAADQEQSLNSLTWEIVIWNTIAVGFMVVALLATKKAVMHVRRWQSNRKVQKLQMIFESKPKLIAWMLLFSIFIWGGSFLLNWSIMYVHIWVVAFYVLGFFMLAAYATRDNQKTSCPHCGVQFTRKQVRQKSMWQYREKCDTCEKPIFVDPKKNGNIVYFIYPSFILFNSILDIHYSLVVIMVISSLWLVYKYVSPYSVQFIAERKDDPKLW